MKSENFLDVAHHPHITYPTKRIQRIDESHFNVVGDLVVARPGVQTETQPGAAP